MLKLNAYGKNHNIYLTTSHYVDNNNLYIEMLTDDAGFLEPWSNITVNLDVKCDKDCGYVDVNNNPGIEKFIRDNNLGQPTCRLRQSGFVVYPEYRFNIEEISKHFYGGNNNG